MSRRDQLIRLTERSGAFCKVLARFTGLLIIALMIGVVADAMLRGMAGVAIWGVLEISVLLLLALIFFGLPSTLALRENFRVSIIADAFPKWLGTPIAWTLLALQLAVIAMLAWFTWRSAIYSFTRQEVAIGMVEIPLWPSRTLVALGFSILVIQTIMLALEFAIKGEHPYAVDLETEIRDELGESRL
jgi:TRAP-type mannitol/chloroaromatic compound transport system permease small subunit